MTSPSVVMIDQPRDPSPFPGAASLEYNPQLTSTSKPDPETSVRASIILACYNSRTDLERGLPALVGTLPPDAEIILIDNASGDNSLEYVRSKYPDIILVRSLSNLGYGGANNLAAGLARGRFLVFLNPDTVVEPGWLEELCAALDRYPDAGMATSQLLLLAELAKINACGNDVHISGLTLCRHLGQPLDALLSIASVTAVSGAAFATRKDLFFHFGGFDEAFFLYVEDTDLSLRFRLAGYSVLCVPTSRVYHDYRLDFSSHKMYSLERNRYRMLLKCFKWQTLLALLPALLLAEIVVWGYVLAHHRGDWRNKLRAYGSVWREWGEIIEGRRFAQSARRISDAGLLRVLKPTLDFQQVRSGWTATFADQIINPLFQAFYRWALVLIKD